MQHVARVFGLELLLAGAFIMAFPNAARRIIRARQEFARLSPDALRLLGSFELLSGALLVWLTTRQAPGARGKTTASEARPVL
ncbi:DUF2065 family protein [Nitrolancea hollandica]|uniref:Uncharacterized protein n=1 Tax=Nitrolancea hollandica Lb TaxID=1129897 RepID=I4EJ30_9BACT|nr:DUF2065 family protein [Nitrolancea hollandica]CCF84692.1 hypothetical protein NITHO_3780005 [Nitrolancea hollandica Lb]